MEPVLLERNSLSPEQQLRREAIEEDVRKRTEQFKMEMERQDPERHARRERRGRIDRSASRTPEQERIGNYFLEHEAQRKCETERKRELETEEHSGRGRRLIAMEERCRDERKGLALHTMSSSSSKFTTSYAQKAERMTRLPMQAVREGRRDASRAPSAASEHTEFADDSPATPRCTIPPGHEWQRTPEEHMRLFQESHPSKCTHCRMCETHLLTWGRTLSFSAYHLSKGPSFEQHPRGTKGTEGTE
ncbi:hypothetical protein K461DRAFT_144969 [Myriangium duriaei CBS 260.36]|uniref:Uncharacterized protein n=1 Tax=Myriangium duriaei CBS 260.36 TaxID=1168546 RepID=A0A9P4IYQ3_9PEZI|nr:hypothetical protein K461DRAFT_144969 [Myriangium duriaei CBS 260.36]